MQNRLNFLIQQERNKILSITNLQELQKLAYKYCGHFCKALLENEERLQRTFDKNDKAVEITTLQRIYNKDEFGNEWVQAGKKKYNKSAVTEIYLLSSYVYRNNHLTDEHFKLMDEFYDLKIK